MSTYCIIDSNGNVLTVFANSQKPTNQNGYAEISVFGGQVGQQWNGIAFVSGNIPVPQSVSVFQAKLALSNAGIYSSVDSYISSNGTESEKIAWQYQQTYNRQDQMLIAVMTAIGQTSAQIDALFVAAATLTP